MISRRLIVLGLVLAVLAGCGGPKASESLGGRWISSATGMVKIDYVAKTVTVAGETMPITIEEDDSDMITFRMDNSNSLVTVKKVDEDEIDYTPQGGATIRLRRPSAQEQIDEGLVK